MPNNPIPYEDQFSKNVTTILASLFGKIAEFCESAKNHIPSASCKTDYDKT